MLSRMFHYECDICGDMLGDEYYKQVALELGWHINARDQAICDGCWRMERGLVETNRIPSG